MQLSELLDKLHDIYDRHGDIDVEVPRDGCSTDPFPEVARCSVTHPEPKSWKVLEL